VDQTFGNSGGENLDLTADVNIAEWSLVLRMSSAVGSFACFAHPRVLLPDLAELRVPFCAYKNSSGCLKTLAIVQTRPKNGDKVVPFCACGKSGLSP
jgi:hypothetical protein